MELGIRIGIFYCSQLLITTLKALAKYTTISAKLEFIRLCKYRYLETTSGRNFKKMKRKNEKTNKDEKKKTVIKEEKVKEKEKNKEQWQEYPREKS